MEAKAFKDAKVNYGVATIPTLPNGKNYAAFGGGKAWIIPSSTKNLEGAQKFVDFLVSTEQQKAFYDATNESQLTLKLVLTLRAKTMS